MVNSSRKAAKGGSLANKIKEIELNIGNRIIVLILGLVIAGFMVWGGSAAHWWALEAYRADVLRGAENLMLPIPLSALIAGGLLAIFFGTTILKEYVDGLMSGTRFREPDMIMEAWFCLCCFAGLFGAIAAPIGGSNDIEGWMTPWGLLLVFGLFPPLIVVKNLVDDIIYDVREKKVAKRSDLRVVGSDTRR